MSSRLSEQDYADILTRRAELRVASPQLRSKPLTPQGKVIRRPTSKSPAVQPLPKAKGTTPRRTPGKMNGLERSYAETVLAPRKLAGEIIEWWFEAITLKLADDCRYTPDFFVLMADLSLEAHETKGFFREDAQLKLKFAAQMFPFKFFLCKKQSKKEGGAWVITEQAT